MSGARLDLVGQRFGKLVVKKFAGIDKYRSALWLCMCDCGTEKVIRSGSLRSGNTSSCGHSQTGAMRCTGLERAVHGHATRKKGKSPTYVSWLSARARCTYPTHTWYLYYGERGITVCDEWMNSFEAFLGDMGERPKDTTLDRIDVNGNYEPGNCRWATPKQQAINRRPRKLDNA